MAKSRSDNVIEVATKEKWVQMKSKLLEDGIDPYGWKFRKKSPRGYTTAEGIGSVGTHMRRGA